MEWEVELIEWIQKTLGSLNSVVGAALSFIGGEIGLLLVLLIILFCWKKESGKRLALIISEYLAAYDQGCRDAAPPLYGIPGSGAGRRGRWKQRFPG